MNRHCSMFEDKQNPTVDHLRRGCFIIKSTKNGDAGGVGGVGASRLEDHRKNPTSSIQVNAIIQEISTLAEPIMHAICDFPVLSFQHTHIGRHNHTHIGSQELLPALQLLLGLPLQQFLCGSSGSVSCLKLPMSISPYTLWSETLSPQLAGTPPPCCQPS